MNFSQNYKVEKLSVNINSPHYDEITPVVTADGKTLYYTRVAHPEFDKSLVYENRYFSGSELDYSSKLKAVYSSILGQDIDNPTNSIFNQDVWIAESEENYFDKVWHPGPPLNNALPNSLCALTPEPDEYIVVNQFEKKGGLKPGFSIIRRYADNTWSNPIAMSIGNYYTYSEGVNITMSSDGKTLILSISREDSHGDNDLYVSHLLDEGHWSIPQNLGPDVNSSYRETTPQLSEDKKTLYFASNRPGMGGSDIYEVKRLNSGWKHWSTPNLLPAPINSSSDDSQPYFNGATGKIYFSSKRDGSSDIYSVKITEPKTQTHITVKGRIINSQTGEVVSGKLYSGLVDGDTEKSYYFSVDGTFKMKIKKGDKYQFEAKKEGFYSQVSFLEFEKDFFYFKDYVFDVFLDPFTVNSKISLDPIFFERSKSFILTESFRALDGLAATLHKYPNMQIRIEGHTDNNGRTEDLQKLSEERAQAVRSYLINENIQSSRIEVTGMGSSRPITKNDSEENKSKNRRVEVIITKEP